MSLDRKCPQQATTCCRPARIGSLRQPGSSHPLPPCAGLSLCERVYFRVCDSLFLSSANEAELHGTAGPPLILSSLFLFLFLSFALVLRR